MGKRGPRPPEGLSDEERARWNDAWMARQQLRLDRQWQNRRDQRVPVAVYIEAAPGEPVRPPVRMNLRFRTDRDSVIGVQWLADGSSGPGDGDPVEEQDDTAQSA